MLKLISTFLLAFLVISCAQSQVGYSTKDKKAIKFFEKCKEMAPSNVNTRQMLYGLYLGEGDTLKAKEQLVKYE